MFVIDLSNSPPGCTALALLRRRRYTSLQFHKNGGINSQEDIEMRSVTMSVNASKFTGRMFAKAVVKLYQHLSKDKAAKDAAKANKDVTPRGKQTVKQLVGQNQGVTSIEIQDRSIKAFERIARKYGVDFAIKKVKGENKHLVFFKGRDMDALKSAFAEYTNQQLNRQKRPSLRMKLKRLKTRSVNQQRNPVRNQHRSQSR